jgi:anti-sigma factor RsiW
MRTEYMHVSDQDLVLAADGELPARAAARVESHLAACWTCRVRQQEIEGAVGEFVRTYRRAFDARLPSSEGPRSRLPGIDGFRAGCGDFRGCCSAPLPASPWPSC